MSLYTYVWILFIQVDINFFPSQLKHVLRMKNRPFFKFQNVISEPGQLRYYTNRDFSLSTVFIINEAVLIFFNMVAYMLYSSLKGLISVKGKACCATRLCSIAGSIYYIFYSIVSCSRLVSTCKVYIFKFVNVLFCFIVSITSNLLKFILIKQMIY